MTVKRVTIYTTQQCPHCMRAKALLKRKNIPFAEIDITDDATKRGEVEKKYGMMTVPIIIMGDQLIGGADHLYDLERKGELDKYL
ncbi:MAG: glutathione S-transferase N-terminal domain-containing protein [Candidatus Omnitrophica bacterium]|nr:glutathione S-transferase N-terminal domain-containing protein [Candidatus Omnitrophota bacterium]